MIQSIHMAMTASRSLAVYGLATSTKTSCSSARRMGTITFRFAYFRGNACRGHLLRTVECNGASLG